jgi:hypothetical protein
LNALIDLPSLNRCRSPLPIHDFPSTIDCQLNALTVCTNLNPLYSLSCVAKGGLAEGNSTAPKPALHLAHHRLEDCAHASYRDAKKYGKNGNVRGTIPTIPVTTAESGPQSPD